CRDFVRLFLNSPRAELSPDDRPDYELCGQQLAQKRFYSSGRVLLLEFHSELTRPLQNPSHVLVYAGFKGGFYFERADQYQTSGTRVDGSTCDYEFLSSSAHKSGQFYSPAYPQNYQPGMTCNYHFRALAGERVRIDFEAIDLGGAENRSACLNGGSSSGSSDQDRLTVADSERDDASGSLYFSFSSYCRFDSKVQTVSQEAYFRVKFVSNADSVIGQGFSARYGFVARHKLQATRPLDRDVLSANGILPNKVIEHTIEFRSSQSKQGVFSSVNYSESKGYPRLAKFTYRFIGRPGEMAHIRFIDFRLDGPVTGSCSSDQGDRVLVYYSSSALGNPNAVFCGTQYSESVYSTGPHLTLVFHTDDRLTLGERGFNGNYYFTERVDKHELDTPKDQGMVATDSKQVTLGCSANREIRSDESSSGVLHSPNYPDGYQQLHCSWTFLGRANKTERVVLEIQELDVESRTTDISTALECTSKDQVTITKYIEMQMSGGKVDAVDKPFCEVRSSRPVRIMSTRIPKLKLSFYTEKASKVRRGLRFKYSFVQDFGILGEHKMQNQSLGCHFEFHSNRASSGNFSSPNYPYAYPEQLTCTYIFRARPHEITRIEFTNFDTETSRRACIPDESDFVTADDCSRPIGLASSQNVLCGRPERGKAFVYKFQATCVRVVFVSNDRYNSPGFLGVYYFDRLSNPALNRRMHVDRLTNLAYLQTTFDELIVFIF
uniref:Cubilin n=2 Tax=Macrostomum lignano TaxID=282301 RepID=A0A1I8JER6_9PLAT